MVMKSGEAVREMISLKGCGQIMKELGDDGAKKSS
jgi:hypothetical protein